MYTIQMDMLYSPLISLLYSFEGSADTGWLIRIPKRCHGQVYDIPAGDYEDMRGDSILIDESNMNRYVNEENKLYMKFIPGRDHHVEFSVPTFTLEGREP